MGPAIKYERKEFGVGMGERVGGGGSKPLLSLMH